MKNPLKSPLMASAMLGALLTGFTQPLRANETLTFPVLSSSDDSEEFVATGANTELASSDLEIVLEAPADPDKKEQIVGVRFDQVTIPQGTQVLEAYIQFTVDELKANDPFDVTIAGEAADATSTFTADDFNISSRPLTAATVRWFDAPAWSLVDAAGPEQRTPDLKAVVQEIVDRGGWTSGSAMSFLIRKTAGSNGGTRTARSYDQNPDKAPRLVIRIPSTESYAVAASSDDAEENKSGGAMDVTSSDIEISHDGSKDQWLGLRFASPAIPQGATIVNAHIQFATDEIGTKNVNPFNVNIRGEAADNAAAYATTASNISSRTQTTATVNWAGIPDWTVVHEAAANQRTPDLAAIVQEIVNRPGYQAGNPLAFIIDGAGARVAESYDGATGDHTNAALAPTLVVTFYTENQVPSIALASPAGGATSLGANGTVQLEASVADPENQPLTVTFLGRQKAPAPGADFTLVTLPDTQFYSENLNDRFTQFLDQTNWIVSSKNALNTAFVAHMGDMTQNYDVIESEFVRADQAMDIIEDPLTTLLAHGIPWGGAPGNHDIGAGGKTEYWNKYFGVSRWFGKPYFRGNYGSDNDNNYQTFSASGLDFIIVNMQYRTTAVQAELDWADSVLKAHPTHRAIVTSHYLIETGNPAAWGGQGRAIYDALKDNPNLFLMLCGHIHGEGQRTDVYQGRTVQTVLQDYQDRSGADGGKGGGDGWLRYFVFSPSTNTISAKTYRPITDEFETDADSEFSFPYDMTNPAPWVELGTVALPGGTTTATLDWNGVPPNTQIEWYAVVSDGADAVGSSIRMFSTAGNIDPTVQITSPASGVTLNLPDPVQLVADANDSNGSISRVEFFSGTQKIGEDTSAPFELSWKPLSGSYTVVARAVDNQGAMTVSAPVSFTLANPSNVAPTVALTTPLEGETVSAENVVLTASTSDTDGIVTMVEFFEGATKLGEATVEPFSFPWPTVTPGAHTVFAVATDNDGGTTTSTSVSFNVLEGYVASFQVGTGGYADSADTMVRSADPDSTNAADGAPYGPLGYVSIDAADGGGINQALIRFDNIIGYGPGQVPPGSTITSAKLNVLIDSAGSGIRVHRMLVDWNEDSTWNTLVGGIQTDGTESVATPDWTVGSNDGNANVPSGEFTIDLSTSVQAWVDGAANHGVALLPFVPNGTNGIDFVTSEHTEVAERPRLVIGYRLRDTAVIAEEHFEAPNSLGIFTGINLGESRAYFRQLPWNFGTTGAIQGNGYGSGYGPTEDWLVLTNPVDLSFYSYVTLQIGAELGFEGPLPQLMYSLDYEIGDPATPNDPNSYNWTVLETVPGDLGETEFITRGPFGIAETSGKLTFGVKYTSAGGGGGQSVRFTVDDFVLRGDYTPPKLLPEVDFETDFAGWSTFNRSSANVWNIGTSASRNCARNNNYNSPAGGDANAIPADDWLVSPLVATAANDYAAIEFDYYQNFGDTAPRPLSVLVSNTYTGGAINPAEWMDITPSSLNGSANNAWLHIDPISIPLSGNVYVAFRYQSAGNGSGTTKNIGVDKVCITKNLLPPPMSVSIAADDTSVTTAESVIFTASVLNGTGPFTYSWDFGDGSALSTAENPAHTYTSAGTYTVSVTVTDSLTATATDTKTSFVAVIQATEEPIPAPMGALRVATFNSFLNRNATGDLLADVSVPGNPQISKVAEIIQRSNPDVMLLNEFDYDPANFAAVVANFKANYLQVSQNGAAPINFAHHFIAPSNTGIQSGYDLDNSGTLGEGGDAYGFGVFEGQYGMVVFSKFPIQTADIRTFQKFLWKDMPGNLVPNGIPAGNYFDPAELGVFRLSSKSHWDVPVNVNGAIVHILASHPTPPVFDDGNDTDLNGYLDPGTTTPIFDWNGRRNSDEIRFWADYVDPSKSGYIYDDTEWANAGNTTPATPSGGLAANQRFVIVGDENADPVDGDSSGPAIDHFLLSALIDSALVPNSSGGLENNNAPGHLGNNAHDTASWGLRADYALPSAFGFEVLDNGVIWPISTDVLNYLVKADASSDHRLVFIDLDFDQLPALGYDAWATAGGVGTRTEDDDSDGHDNFTEYLFQLDPKSGAMNGNLPAMEIVNGRPQVRYTRVENPALIWTYEKSTNLTQWTPMTEGVDFQVIAKASNPATQTEAVTFELLANPQPDKCFVRVKATE